MNKGFFIVIDGIDGCGSSTQVKFLGEFLESKGIKTHLTVEPSEFDVGKLLRKYLRKSDIPSPTDALLFAADRVEHYYNEILPKITEGITVISDRYLESSIAYQAAQGILERENKQPKFNIDVEWIKRINKYAVKPDLTIILDIDPKISLTRKYTPEDEIDKFEKAGFLEIVRDIYLNRAKEEKFEIIDASMPLKSVQDKIIEIIEKKMQ